MEVNEFNKFKNLNNAFGLIYLNWVSLPILSIWIIIDKGFWYFILFAILVILSLIIIHKFFEIHNQELMNRYSYSNENYQEYTKFGINPDTELKNFYYDIKFSNTLTSISIIISPWIIAGFILGWF